MCDLYSSERSARVDHYINESYVDDGLDPQHSHSIVNATQVPGHAPVLLGAIFLRPPGRSGPDIGGSLTRWHQHSLACINGRLNVRDPHRPITPAQPLPPASTRPTCCTYGWCPTPVGRSPTTSAGSRAGCRAAGAGHETTARIELKPGRALPCRVPAQASVWHRRNGYRIPAAGCDQRGPHQKRTTDAVLPGRLQGGRPAQRGS